MNSRPAIAILALAILTLPSVQAAGFEFGASKILEKPLDPGSSQVFEMPLEIGGDGYLYTKMLATPANAINDGSSPNGSVEHGTGWRLSLALVGPDGAPRELGTVVDSTMSELVAVKSGEAWKLVMTVHIPENAADGGGRQRAYVALAFRPGADVANPGSASGAQIDESRAITLLMTNALLPDPVPTTPEPPVEGGAGEPVVAIPPVQPIDESGTQGGQVIVVQQALPTWFLVVSLVILGAVAVCVAAVAYLLVLVRSELRAERGRTDASRDAGMRTIPVQTEQDAARQFLSTMAARRESKPLEDARAPEE